MRDSLIRAARTFVQAFVGAFLASGALSAISDTGIVDWNILKGAVVAAAVAGLAALLSWIQNELENAGAKLGPK